MKTTIMKKAEDGRVHLREAILLAFFLPTPIHEFGQKLGSVVERYLKEIPEGALTWSAIGANTEEWSPVRKTTFSRCLTQLDPSKAKARPLTCFELTDGPLGAEAPGYGIQVVGSPGGDATLPDERSLIQMSFPFEAVEQPTVDRFVDFCRQTAALIPYISGYASPVLQWALLHRPEAMEMARGLALRHPGYDVQYNFAGRLRLGNRVRGARWLSFLGSEVVRSLGGETRLRDAFSKAISVSQAGEGLMIRAGEMPELGDVNKGVGVPLLREVATALEPATAFRELVLLGNFANHDETLLERWERRFLTNGNTR